MFIYEERLPKRGDTIEMRQIKLNDSYGNFSCTYDILNKLKRNKSLMFVRKVTKDGNMIQIGSKKTGNFDEMFIPSSFFRVVKVPKTNDIVNWLYDNQLINYPEQWTPFKTQVDSISRYVVSIFQNNLRALHMINKYTNHLYFTNDSFELLIYYKTVVQQLGLVHSERYAKFNSRSIKSKFIKICLEINPLWHTRDAIGLYMIYELFLRKQHDTLILTDNLTSVQIVSFYNDPKLKAQYFNQKEIQADLTNRIIELQKENDLIQVSNDTRFIKILDQNIIDELELVVFNVKTLPHQNKILFIFIDKDNNKRFYLEDFNYVFYVSNNSNIIHNDYIEDYDDKKHQAFVIRKFDILRTLKFSVNDNYKRFMKKGKL